MEGERSCPGFDIAAWWTECYAEAKLNVYQLGQKEENILLESIMIQGNTHNHSFPKYCCVNFYLESKLKTYLCCLAVDASALSYLCYVFL